jgi:hypothetical protein
MLFNLTSDKSRSSSEENEYEIQLARTEFPNFKILEDSFIKEKEQKYHGFIPSSFELIPAAWDASRI